MFELHPANQLGNLEQMAKTRRPIRDSQAGVIAGYQPAGNKQQQSQSSNKYRETMLSGVIRGRGQNSSLKYQLFYSKISSGARDPHSLSKIPSFNEIALNTKP